MSRFIVRKVAVLGAGAWYWQNRTPVGVAAGGESGRASIPTQAGPTEIRITLSEGGISPNGQRVNLHHGEQFTLEITTDRDDILHVHGFDTEITVKAGERTTKTMRADRIGRYEIESHDPPLVTVMLQIS